ncbi:MAG: ROK family protein, partial [Akkermansiaceae bacterium]
MKPRLLGGVEAGGTKMVCAVAWSPDEVLLEERFETTTPAETLSRVESFFRKCEREHGELASIGYGTFGPANVNPLSPKYGTILPTPKEHWEGTDLLGFLQGAFPKAELAIDTDVNAAALGEGFAGAAKGLENYVYITV